MNVSFTELGVSIPLEGTNRACNSAGFARIAFNTSMVSKQHQTTRSAGSISSLILSLNAILTNRAFSTVARDSSVWKWNIL